MRRFNIWRWFKFHRFPLRYRTLYNFASETGVDPNGDVDRLIKAHSLHILLNFFTLGHPPNSAFEIFGANSKHSKGVYFAVRL